MVCQTNRDHARERGDIDQARQLIDRAVLLQADLNDSQFRPLAQLEQAMVLRALDQPLAAARVLTPTVEETLRGSNWMAGAPCLDGLALIALDLGKEEAAVAFHTGADRLRRDSPWEINPWDLPERASLGASIAASADPERYREAVAVGESLDTTQIRRFAKSLQEP